MADMEVHEHIVVDGRDCKVEASAHSSTMSSHFHATFESTTSIPTGKRACGCREKRVHGSCRLRCWEVRPSGGAGCGKKFLRMPGSPALFFLYKYVFRLGFLDGVPGLIYCGLQGIQFFHIKAKIYELRAGKD